MKTQQISTHESGPVRTSLDLHVNNSLDLKVGELLLERGQVHKADLDRARSVLCSTPGNLASTLLKLGVASEQHVIGTISELLDMQVVAPGAYPDTDILDGAISERFLREHQALPLAEHNGELELALADPEDQFIIDAISLASGKRVLPMLAIPSQLEAAIEQVFGDGRSLMGQLIDEIGTPETAAEEDIEHLKDLASEAPIVKIVNLVIKRAIENNASDIHIEPFRDRLKVRLRIDGILREVESPTQHSSSAVISRIKLMAKLNIAEHRLPQDGRIKLRIQGKELDLRVSTVPTVYGESVVIRLLNNDSIELDFAAQGFGKREREEFTAQLQQPHGIILVTGPTGSGKTTTLYTALSILNTNECKIITVEDPVEYQLEGINQIQVKPRIDLTFANALRSIVRQDPDVIMIGEMRDLETARIAVQSAMTGHLVLSTLHTNDASSSISRLLDMGLEDFLFISTVNAILAQRLVRKLCIHCRETQPALPEVVTEYELDSYTDNTPVMLYRSTGCDHCGGTGYHGRTAIIELMPINDTLRRMIVQKATPADIQQAAMDNGMHTMYQDGLIKALSGITSIEEVLRVTREAG